MSVCLSILKDLRKAFDTIDHSIFFEKLKYGVQRVCLYWFISYSNYRKQFVQTRGADSILSTIPCGVPQGSIFPPLFFVNNITDIQNSRKDIVPYFFAVETNSFYTQPKKQTKSYLD